MHNTLPTTAAITTQDLIGFILYSVVYLPIVWFIKPRHIKMFLPASFALNIIVFTSLLGWALASNGGPGPSSVLAVSKHLTTSQKALRFVQCISSVSGTWGGATDRYSDWSRFEKKKGRCLPGLIVLPVMVVIVGSFGVLITNATADMYGVVEWNPTLLLSYIQGRFYTPAVRAITFFAGLAMFYCQVCVNMTDNSIAFGMDVSAAIPRYFNIRRATFLLVLLTIAIQPWRFLSQAAIFVTVLSSVTGSH
jgi:NCS1 family nucleobase:cation symporter-1